MLQLTKDIEELTEFITTKLVPEQGKQAAAEERLAKAKAESAELLDASAAIQVRSNPTLQLDSSPELRLFPDIRAESVVSALERACCACML